MCECLQNITCKTYGFNSYPDCLKDLLPIPTVYLISIFSLHKMHKSSGPLTGNTYSVLGDGLMCPSTCKTTLIYAIWP